jgi:hypothetical protein
MKLKAYAIFLIVFMVLSSQLVAFDGLRKGFILGGGVGPGYLFNEGTDRFCLATNFKIGYAPSNSFEIYYLNTVSWFGAGSSTFINGITGLGLTKYLKPEGRGFFVFGGVGLAVLREFTGGEDDTGFGLIGGIGYDIAKHWSIQGDIIYTNYADEGWHSLGVRVSVNFLAF